MHPSQQSGFTLVEVLVSVFVLALGVIGVAGMQLTAMRNSQQSNYQTTAVQMASELADKMRANATMMNKADSANPFLFSFDSPTDSIGTSSACYGATSCGAEDMANFDLAEWKLRLKNSLPGGRVIVCRDKEPIVNGSPTWDCSAPTVGGVNSPMVVKVGWQVKKSHENDKSEVDASGNFLPRVVITVESYTNPQQ